MKEKEEIINSYL